jgi:hypothetical protein
MRKMLKIAAISAAVGLMVVGVSLFSIYEASQLVPEFYHEAISRDPAEQQDARDQFVARATSLASDLHRTGAWQSLFTEDQINGWLALELSANYPDVLPGELREPRISIREKEATIACRYETDEMAAVLSLTVDAYVQDSNTLALRIRRARAGALPVPLAQVLDAISQAARQLELRLEWRKTQGDPVALISFPQPTTSRSEALWLQAIELRHGELFVSGSIGASPKVAGSSVPESPAATAAEAETSDATQPVVGAAPSDTRQK